MPLGSLAEIGTGSHDTKDAIGQGIYPFYARGVDVLSLDSFDFDETAVITAGDGVGVGKVMHFVEGKYALHQRAYRIHVTSPNLNPKYYYHFMRANFLDYMERKAVSSSVASVRKKMLEDYPIPVPSLEEQERIVFILDKFDTLVNDISQGLPAEIEARQKQYKYYRDKLLAFKEKAA